MNVQPEKFANLLGAAAGKVLRVSRRQLSVSMECPLHSDGETSLSCSPGPKVVFSCSNPSCRFRGDAASLPIVALSANARDEDRAQSLESGMNAHLAKPLDIAELTAELDRAQAARAAAV